MIDYNLKEVGESSFEIEWLGKKPKMTMVNLYKLYRNMEFISTSGKSKQCSQFGSDLKKALQNDLGSEYSVELSVGHFYISGFVNKIGTDKYVYFNVEDLRDNDNGFERVLFRSAESDRDYRGGSNNYCNLYELDKYIKNMLEK